jgi:hypothetical protein
VDGIWTQIHHIILPPAFGERHRLTGECAIRRLRSHTGLFRIGSKAGALRRHRIVFRGLAVASSERPCRSRRGRSSR